MGDIKLATPVDIGKMIRSRRKEVGFTLKRFSMLTGHSVRFLSELERGKPGAAIESVMTIMRELGIDLYGHPR